MIKMKLLGCVGLSILLASKAWADTNATSKLKLMGTVPPTCSFGVISTSGDASFADGNGSDKTVTFTTFIDSTGKHSRQDLDITFAGATCNYTAKLGLKSDSGGLKSAGSAAASGFAGTVNYTATATWGTGGPSVTLTTAGSSIASNSAVIPARVADLTLHIQTIASSQPLLTYGNPYVDTLTLQIGDAL